MSQNGDLALEDKLILASQVNIADVAKAVLYRAILYYIIVVTTILLILYAQVLPYYISLGFLLFLSSGIVFIIGGTIGTLGTSPSIGYLSTLIGIKDDPKSEKQKRANTQKRFGSSIIFTTAGIMLFITSYFFY